MWTKRLIAVGAGLVAATAALLSACCGDAKRDNQCNAPQRCEMANSPGVQECRNGQYQPCDTSKCLGAETRSCATQLGECLGGEQTCEDGAWGACSRPPTQEQCDSRDNDCDGTPDNGCSCPASTTRNCPEQDGACLGSFQACESGTWGECSKLPGEEIGCDGTDRDCDGAINEGCECTTGNTQNCEQQHGECQGAIQACVDGLWGECSKVASVERCDGKDNDCDGEFDEGCPCTSGATQSCGTDLGECAAGTQTCVNGNWGACADSTEPADRTERCDGKDNDCDGDTDEGCPCTAGAEQPCGTDLGECTAGKQTCSGGNWGECEGSSAPEDPTELCDDKDNDCDGTIDEGFIVGTTCVAAGSCPGTTTCTPAGNAATCVPDSARFGSEICDGLDNDCNGLIDLEDAGGKIVSTCDCGSQALTIGEVSDNSSSNSLGDCDAPTKCGADFVPRRSLDGVCRAVCDSTASDPDGDGWGFENGSSCLVEQRAPWMSSTQCPGEGFPVGVSMKYCLDCSGSDDPPYSSCQSQRTYDFSGFASGTQWLRVDYTYDAPGAATTPVNLWFDAGGERRKHLPLVAVGDAPGRHQLPFRIDNACFKPTTQFGDDCVGQGTACDHCNADEVCGNPAQCAAYDLTQVRLQVAAEFCAPESGLHSGRVIIHKVEFVEPNCSE